MRAVRFDALTKALTASRRRAVKTLLAGSFSALFATHREEAAAGCKKVGKKCDKSNDCCEGARCKGGKHGKCKCKSGLTSCPGEKGCADLAIDIDNCGACGQRCGGSTTCVAGICTAAVCPAGADACAGNRVNCLGGPNCVCSRSTEGLTICGDAGTPGASCGQCENSADCVAFGPGAFCVETGSVNCCGSGTQNVCRLPCNAT